MCEETRAELALLSKFVFPLKLKGRKFQCKEQQQQQKKKRIRKILLLLAAAKCQGRWRGGSLLPLPVHGGISAPLSFAEAKSRSFCPKPPMTLPYTLCPVEVVEATVLQGRC